jgi:hypothetical protein
VHKDSTEGEMTVTSSDDLPSPIDVAEYLYHDEFEIPALSNDVLISMSAYPTSTSLTVQYLDDVIQFDTMNMDNTTMGIICMSCNLSY